MRILPWIRTNLAIGEIYAQQRPPRIPQLVNKRRVQNHLREPQKGDLPLPTLLSTSIDRRPRVPTAAAPDRAANTDIVQLYVVCPEFAPVQE